MTASMSLPRPAIAAPVPGVATTVAEAPGMTPYLCRLDDRAGTHQSPSRILALGVHSNASCIRVWPGTRSNRATGSASRAPLEFMAIHGQYLRAA